MIWGMLIRDGESDNSSLEDEFHWQFHNGRSFGHFWAMFKHSTCVGIIHTYMVSPRFTTFHHVSPCLTFNFSKGKPCTANPRLDAVASLASLASKSGPEGPPAEAAEAVTEGAAEAAPAAPSLVRVASDTWSLSHEGFISLVI